MVWKHVRRLLKSGARLWKESKSAPQMHTDRLMDHLNEHLTSSFFNSLPQEPDHGRIRYFEFAGRRYVIKDTQGLQHHGDDKQFIRRIILAHQRAVKSGKITANYYTIRTPKVHGRIRRGEKQSYLIMENVGGQRRGMANEIYPGNRAVFKQSAEAFKEMRTNFEILRKQKLLPTSPHTDYQVPQINEMIFTHHTNPEQPEKGKWVVSLPYDFG
tara:strand:+ start:306 stop:947 length:642 start_codon:yes stop_codon:yes gene_type:complete